MITGTLLGICRFIAFILWSIFCIIVCTPFIVLAPGWKGVLNASKCTSFWAKGLVKILGINIRVKGDIEAVKGGLIVSNHLSYVDIILHASLFNVRFSPKHDIKNWPGIGFLVMMSRPIWVDRSSKQASKQTLNEFRETMLNGINLLVYPEGTTSDGKQILPFKSTPFEAVISEYLPIFPILTRYLQKKDEAPVPWFGDMGFIEHLVKLLTLPRIDAEIKILNRIDPRTQDRKKLAAEVHQFMEQNYQVLIANE